MIVGNKVPRPTKEQLAAAIATELKIAAPNVSSGATVDSQFLDAIHTTITGEPTGGSDAYRKTEILLDRLNLTYDPYWDTSESAEAGGSTVTARAYSRIRTALTGTPRCFILNVTDAPVGTKWEQNHDAVYRYDDTVTARRPINDAGPGSRVVYYATSNSSTNPMHFVATATVGYIYPGWTGPWELRLEDYTEFTTPVPAAELQMAGWNHQHAITEIDYPTFTALVAAGGATVPAPIVGGPSDQPAEAADPGGADVAERVTADFPAEQAAAAVTVPDVLPQLPMAQGPALVPWYIEDGDSVVGTDVAFGPQRSRNQRRDKVAEMRAVDLVRKALANEGWSCTRDRQRDGVGYDLEFEKPPRRLKVEVKGIQGTRLTFNVTPKEYWRAQTDPDWVLMAVTSVLSPSKFELHLVTRDRVVEATRTILGYRIKL